MTFCARFVYFCVVIETGQFPMDKLTKYESIEELKSMAKPMDRTSIKSQKRHDWFDGFIDFLKSDGVKDTSRSQSRDTMHEL